jgi:hypothetical protein
LQFKSGLTISLPIHSGGWTIVLRGPEMINSDPILSETSEVFPFPFFVDVIFSPISFGLIGPFTSWRFSPYQFAKMSLLGLDGDFQQAKHSQCFTGA